MAPEIDENELPLSEFIKLPTTVDFGSFNSEEFRRYIQDKPYIKVGKELASGFLVAYTNQNKVQKIFEDFEGSVFEFFPKILSPLDQKTNTAAGITPILQHPHLGLTGKGVIIGIVDTGIDYTKDIFQYEDGASKIISIWDQSIDGDRPDDMYLGAVYPREKINKALRSENPYEIVPSVDTDGHGTFLASVATGRQTDEFIGAAPEADLIVVKLRRANQYYIDRYFRLPDEPNLYESSDYLLGANYIIEKARELNVPVVLCVGMGSNQGTHDGNSILEDYFSFISKMPRHAVVTAAGNESNAKHHTFDVIPRTGSTKVVGVRVGVERTSFAMTIIGSPYDKVSVGITSPTGEVVSRIPYRLGLETKEEFTFEKTTVTIGYYKDVNTLIFITFEDAKEGIWEITLYGDFILSGEFHGWLPITGQVSPKVEFMKPVPETTIVFPATSIRSITCGAYNSDNNSLYITSSWGPTLLPRMSPDLVAPGVNVGGFYPTGYGAMTGTSVAAAITAGAAALLMEWGIVQGNLKSMDGDMIRNLLGTGCKREEGVKYPNIKWGYGKLDLLGTFLSIVGSNVQFDRSMSVQRLTELLHLR